MIKISLAIDEKLYLKDPNSSELGRKIITHSILLLDEIGFEAFTFKKLAEQIGATEPTIYRYFENKYKLLNYLLAWYWLWIEYRLEQSWKWIDAPADRLKNAIELLSSPIEKDPIFDFIDEKVLYRVVVNESPKVYLLKDVDRINKEGLYHGYKRVTRMIGNLVKEINPDYRFPNALVSTVLEASHSQKYFAEHLPSLTEVSYKAPNATTEFLMEMVFRVVNTKKN